MYKVELGFVHGRIVSGARAVGRFGQRALGVFQSGVVQDTVSDSQDVINTLRGRPQIEVLPSAASTTLTASATPTFQTRTSQARQQTQSAKLPLLIGGGVLAAILLLRK